MKTPTQHRSKYSRVRHATGNVHLSATASGLTSPAGLIPVVNFFARMGFEELIQQTVPHTRGDNACYQLADGMLLIMVGMIAGATSMAKVCAVWSAGVLAKIAGWLQ